MSVPSIGLDMECLKGRVDELLLFSRKKSEKRTLS